MTGQQEEHEACNSRLASCMLRPSQETLDKSWRKKYK